MNVINLILFFFFALRVNAADAEKENLMPNLQPCLKKAVKENITPPPSMPNKENLSVVSSPSQLAEIKFRGELTEKALETLKEPWERIILVTAFRKSEEGFSRRQSLLISSDALFKGVKSLSLHWCGLEDKAIKRIGELSHIRELSLPVNQITDEGVLAISRLSRLKKLNLNSNNITNKGMDIIANSMPDLTDLDVSLNEKVSDAGVDPFLHSTNLTTLIIEFNNITPEKARELKAHIKKVDYFPGKKIAPPEIMMEW